MDDVELIKNNVDIVDFIGKYMELKPAGANYKGLSPFQPEKTASFIVSPSKNIWHDFSANIGGDVISFTEKIENVDFLEALEILANYAGIKLQSQKKSLSNLENPKSKLYQVLNLAKNFYQKNLIQNAGALEYLKSRNITKESIINFQIGYSPSDYSQLYGILRPKFSEGLLLTSTLFKKNRNGKIYDFFRGRIMLPVNDYSGKVIGFSARQIINDPQSGKYINSADNPIYQKSKILYGIFQAKHEIARLKQVIIVEGNLDCIKLHQVDKKNSIAISGTALTKPQLQILRPLAEEIILGLDSDRAGTAATLKSLAIILDGSVKVSILDYKDCKDIDEYIDKYGKVGVDKLLAMRLSAPEFLAKHFNAQYKDLALKHWLLFIQTLESELVIDQYLQYLVSLFNVDFKLLKTSLKNNNTNSGNSGYFSPKPKVNKLDNFYIKLLALLNHAFETGIKWDDLIYLIKGLKNTELLATLVAKQDFSLATIREELLEFSDQVAAEAVLLEQANPSSELTKKEIDAIITEINKVIINREISELKILISSENEVARKKKLLTDLQDKLRELKGY